MEYKEYLVKRNKNGKEKFLTLLLYLAATVLAFICFALLINFGGIGLLLAVGMYFGAHKISARFNREYEYIITGYGVDIDVIYNRTSRKRLISFSVNEAAVIASVKDENHKHYLNGTFDKEISAITNSKGANVYFAVVEADGRTLVKFEPPYAALEILKKHAPSKVFM